MTHRRIIALAALLVSCRFTLDRELGPGEVRAHLVVAGDHGTQPAGGARLVLESTRLGATADANGQLVLRRVPSGKWTVRATWSATEGSAAQYAIRLTGVELGSVDGTTDAVDLGTVTLGAVGAIEGVVVDDGVPVAGAIVAGTGAGQARTDVDGRFRLPTLAEGSYALAVAPATGGLFVEHQATVTRAKTSSITIDLKDLHPGTAGRVTGRAQELDVPVTQPIAVRLDGADQHLAFDTDDHGRLDSVQLMPPGAYAIALKAVDGASLRVEPVLVNGDTDVGDLVLVPESGADGVLELVSGNAQEAIVDGPLPEPIVLRLSAGGAPIAGASIVLHATGLDESQFTHVTDEDGQISFVPVLADEAGPVEIIASAAGTNDVTITATALPGPLFRFTLDGLDSPFVAGTTGALRLTALDSHGNRVTTFEGEVALTTSDLRADLAPVTFTLADAGVKSVNVTLVTVGTQRVDATSGTSTGALEGLVVIAGDPARLRLTEVDRTVTAGLGFVATVRIEDAVGNTSPGWTGTLGVLIDGAPSSTFLDQVVTGNAQTLFVGGTLFVAQTSLLTVRDLAGKLAPAEGTVTVTPGPAKRLAISGAPASIASRTTFSPRVEVFDQWDNRAPAQGSHVSFLSDDFASPATPPHVLTTADGGEWSERVRLVSARTTALWAVLTPGPINSNRVSVVVSGAATQAQPEVPVSIAGCTTFRYTLGAGVPQRLDVLPEFSLDGGPWKRVTTGPTQGAGDEGLLAREAGAAVPHRFVWDTQQDLPHHTLAAGRVRLRLTGSAPGTPGTPVETAMPAVQNGPQIATAFSVTLPLAARALAVGHLDRDRKLDAFWSANGESGTYHSLASGTAPGTARFAGLDARDFALVDLNRDGLLDGVAAAGTALTPLLNGSFFTAGTPIALAGAPSRVAAGDFNLDGWPDLVALIPTGLVLVLANRAGGFSPPTTIAIANPVALGTGDVTGDGVDDVVVAAQGSTVLTIALGARGASSLSPSPVTIPAVPLDLVVADVTGDGRLDAVTLHASGVSVHSIPAGGALTTKVIAGTVAGERLAAGDLDGDGAADIVVTSTSGTGLQIVTRLGSEAIVTSRNRPRYGAIAIGDADGDGDGDLLGTDATATGLLPNAQPARCTAGLATGLVESGATGATLGAIGDFDDDGRLDLATAVPGGNTVQVLRSRGDGTFVPLETLSVDPVSVVAPWVDDEGVTHVASISTTGVIELSTVGGSRPLAIRDANAVSGPFSVDLDRDGRRDLVAIDRDGQGRWWKGSGGLSFGPLRVFGANARMSSVVPYENPLTGLVDFFGLGGGLGSLTATAPGEYGSWNVRLSSGGSVPVVAWRRSAQVPFAVATLTQGSRTEVTSVAAASGSGTFILNESYSRLFAADFNGDGWDELFVVGDTGTTAQVDGVAPAANLGSARTFLPADLDGDGHVDLVTLDADGTRRTYLGGPNGLAVLRPLPGSVAALHGAGRPRPGAPDLLLATHPPSIFNSNTSSSAWEIARDPAMSTNTLVVGAEALALGRVDADGLADLVGLTLGTVAVKPGLTAGGFAVGLSAQLPGVKGPAFLVDQDRDGLLDLVTLGQGSTNALQFTKGLGTGSFGATAGAALTGATVLTVIDADRDGIEDALVGTNTGAWLLRGVDGAARWGTAAQVYPGNVVAVCAGDVDGDGTVELFAALDDRGFVRRSWVGGALGAAVVSPFDAVVTDCAVRDLDADGQPELLALANGLRVREGSSETRLATGPGTCLATGDFDGDGAQDLAVGCGSEARATIVFGR